MTRLTPCTVLALTIAFLAVAVTAAGAAVGCTLNDPDRDVLRLFPDATSYRTEFVSIAERGGDSLATRIETALGGELDPVFEALDVPYAYYTVLKGTRTIGRIHGVNQKGMYGGMQLILATDPSGTIVDFYYQRISSPESASFRDEAFTDSFKGLTLPDLMAVLKSETASVPAEAGDALPACCTVKDPSRESAEDFDATVRGITKNLLLLHAFFPVEEHVGQTH